MVSILRDDGIVRLLLKGKSVCFIAVILLGAVAWIKIGSLIQQCISAIPLIRGSLSTFVYGNPELAEGFALGQV